MKYRLIYTRRALRDIDGLDDLTKKRVGKALARYEGDPFKHAERRRIHGWEPIGFASGLTASFLMLRAKI